MPKITVELHIGEKEFLKYYKGHAKDVSTVSLDGRTVRFPARVLREFMTHTGVDGMFDIYFDSNGKFEEIKRV